MRDPYILKRLNEMHRVSEEDLRFLRPKKVKQTNIKDENEIHHIVVEGFLTILNREPSYNEFTSYTEEIKKGLSKENFQKKLVHSEEFKQIVRNNIIRNSNDKK